MSITARFYNDDPGAVHSKPIVARINLSHVVTSGTCQVLNLFAPDEAGRQDRPPRLNGYCPVASLLMGLGRSRYVSMAD